MRRALLVAFIALLVPAAAIAQTGDVKITADTFVVAEDHGTATFSGNVVVISPEVEVRAPTVVVHYAGNNTSDITSLEATGGVRLKTADQVATGDRGVYDPKTHILKLNGNVVVTNASGTLKGPQLIVNLETRVSTFTSSGGGRVTGVFQAK